MLQLFSERPDIEGTLLWTPGHGGLDQMKITDKNTKAAANMKCRDSGYLLPLFVSRSSALTKVETHTGDKGPNNHWAHCEHIESIGNM